MVTDGPLCFTRTKSRALVSRVAIFATKLIFRAKILAVVWDQHDNPTIFVTYDNAQAVPLYMIYYTTSEALRPMSDAPSAHVRCTFGPCPMPLRPMSDAPSAHVRCTFGPCPMHLRPMSDAPSALPFPSASCSSHTATSHHLRGQTFRCRLTTWIFFSDVNARWMTRL